VRAADLALVAAVGFATLLPFLGQTRDVATHELRHAEIAREMADGGGVLVPRLLGEEYADKPPVMHAMIAALYRLAGAPSLALARVPSVVAGVMGALAVYGIGMTVVDRPAALLAATGLLATLGYRRMARVARPDMIFVAAILVGCFFLLRALRTARPPVIALALAGAAAGFATVTKGPLGVLVPGIVAVLAARRRERPTRLREWAVLAAGAVAVLIAWTGALWLTGHADYLYRVVTQPDVAGADPEPGSVRAYAVALVVGFLPLTLLLPALVHAVRRRGPGLALAVALLLLVVLVAVPKKRRHYLLPVYPFLVLAVAEAVTRADTPRLARTTGALVALSLAAGPLWYAATPPGALATEEPKLTMARRVLEVVPAGRRIVCMDELAEAIAFTGRRDGVAEVMDVPSVVREAKRNGAGSYVVIPAGRAAHLDTAAARRGLRLTSLERDELPVHGHVRGWLVYRVEP